MTNLSSEYSTHWKDLGTVLVYQTPDFQFHSSVIITEFEDCLIKRLAGKKMYHSINPKSISLHDDEFVKKIREESKDLSIVIISNQISTNKLIIDMIKSKLEQFIKIHKIPILAMFALKPNRLSKPHTGLWTLLNAYYRSKGKTQIQKSCIVSDFGGCITENVRKNGDVTVSTSISDVDRAFATNIGVPFYTIKEYLNPHITERFTWNNKSLSPELRKMYIETLSKYKNPNIFAKLAELGESDGYMILIYGAPCSGKTTLAKELISKWRSSEYGKRHAIKRLGRDKYSKTRRITLAKKLLADHITVIIDGDCHNVLLRSPFEQIANELKIPILYIEVNPSIDFAYIFNHVAVETSQDEEKILYSDREYFIYKSNNSRPADTILYAPIIKQTEQIMNYRY